MQREPTTGYNLVKDNLFHLTKKVKCEDGNEKDEDIFNEDMIIQLLPDSDKKGMFGRPLRQIFGFFEATYYIEKDDKVKTFNLHLLSDKPFSFSEIRVLKLRLDIAYGGKYKHFNIYQEPDSDQDADRWMSLRGDFEDVPNTDRKYDKHKGTYTKEVFPYTKKTGINRKIGKIYEFSSTHYGKEYNFKKLMEANNKAKKLNKKDIVDKIFNALKVISKTKSFGKYEVVSLFKDKEKQILTINILSDDRRIDDIVSNEDINKKICEVLKINKLVVNREDLT